MRNTIFSLALVGILMVLMWNVVTSIRDKQRPGDLPPKREGSVLSLQRLKENERVVMVLRTPRVEADTMERIYQVDGGSPLRFASRELALKESRERLRVPEFAGRLRIEEAVGLDSYLLFLRRGFGGYGHMRQEIVVGYYRDGTRIGEERFQDSTNSFSEMRYEKGQLLRPSESQIEDFPVEVFREIIPPWVIEERFKEPNQALEPTTTAVTDRAGARSAPAAVVAHL